jgi:hypothetical protein
MYILNKTFTDTDGDSVQIRASSNSLVLDAKEQNAFRGDQNAITVFTLEQALAIRDALIEAFPLEQPELVELETTTPKSAAPQEFAVGELECLPSTSITINIASLIINA